MSVPQNIEEKDNTIAQLSKEHPNNQSENIEGSIQGYPPNWIKRKKPRRHQHQSIINQQIKLTQILSSRRRRYSITPLLSSTLFRSSPVIIASFPSFPIAAAVLLAGFSTPLKVLLNQPETRPGGPLPAISV
jgi:hypothetical protein